MPHAPLKVLTISIRHLLPMNELARAIFTFLAPPLSPPPALEPPLSLPPPQAASVTARTTATLEAPILHPAMRMRIPSLPSQLGAYRGSPAVAAAPEYGKKIVSPSALRRAKLTNGPPSVKPRGVGEVTHRGVDQREGLTSTTRSRPDTEAGGRSVADLRTRTLALRRSGSGRNRWCAP